MQSGNAYSWRSSIANRILSLITEKKNIYNKKKQMRPLLIKTPTAPYHRVMPRFDGFQRGIDGNLQFSTLPNQMPNLEQTACKRYDYQNMIPLKPIHERYQRGLSDFGGFQSSNMQNTNTPVKPQYSPITSKTY